MKKTLFSLVFLTLNLAFAKAQLVEAPLTCNKTLYRNSKTSESQARTQSLNLPFLDDFSYLSSYPNPNLWQNSRTTWVNRGMGKRPPTVGVATLDGLNATGAPYAWQPGATGSSCDTLLSQPIDLTSFSTNDSVYFSFFYQPGGFGDAPEFSDKLFVEFKNNAGNWVTLKTINGQVGTVPDFQQISIYIGTAYLGNSAFQFRFRNVGSRLGARDHWHIDYVKLDKNRRFSEPNFQDVAFYETALSPFTNYTAMPYKQFKVLTPTDRATIMAPNVNFKVVNHFNIPKSPILSVQVFDKYSGTQIVPNVNPALPVITAGTYTSIVPTQQVGPSSYDFSNLPLADSALLVVRYSLNAPGQDTLVNQPSYQISNDIVERLVPLEDYFAYDDGSAESSIITQNIGTQAAVKFHTIIGDTLQGIRMHVPAFDVSVANQLFNFSVYVGSLNSNPVYEAYNLRPFYGDSLQYWATYAFIGQNGYPPLIPANTDFYIVWQQGSSGQAIPIGLDKNSPQATQFMYQNTGAGWNPLGANVSGALMMRPYLGSKRFIANETPRLQYAPLTVYPNPTTGLLTVDFSNLKNAQESINYTIFDALGRKIQTAILTGNQIDLTPLQTGFYILHINNEKGEIIGVNKVLKR